MIIFDSEEDFLKKINEHFHYIVDFTNDVISYDEFNDRYNSFYYYFALDGHESDSEEKQLLLKYNSIIKFFEEVSSILYGICSDEDALKEIYINSGRYNSQIAKQRLKELIKDTGTIFNKAI